MHGQQTLISLGETFGSPDAFHSIGFPPAMDVAVLDHPLQDVEDGNRLFATFNAPVRCRGSWVPSRTPRNAPKSRLALRVCPVTRVLLSGWPSPTLSSLLRIGVPHNQ